MPAAVTKCDRCRRPSAAWLRYCGQRLCTEHLRRFVDQRVSAEIRRQGGIASDARILVGLSGGKDSTVALHQIVRLSQMRPDVEVAAVTIDEGIAGYRPAGLASAERTARLLGVEHIVKRTVDLAGATMDQVHEAQPKRRECSYCGVFRRRLLNDAARQWGADVVVTGHNLDDMAQSVLMNLSQGDLTRLLRLGPHETAQPGLIPRRMPMRQIPEMEVYLYAMTAGYHWHDGECPYAAGAQRTLYRDVVGRLEDARPGTRHALLRTQDALAPRLAGEPTSAPTKRCVTCGQPTSGSRCQVCLLSDEVYEMTGVSTLAET